MTGNRTACKAWRLTGWAAIAVIVAALLPFVARAGGSGDQPVTLSIANEGPGPLRCMVLFAHFVTTDAGNTNRYDHIVVVDPVLEVQGAKPTRVAKPGAPGRVEHVN